MTELWHFSEDPSSRPTSLPRDGKVWAIDGRYGWLYWFPRDCPRACFWAVEETTDDDVERWLDGDRDRRVAVIETAWLERVRDVGLYAYRMPPEPFDVVEDERFYIASVPVDRDRARRGRRPARAPRRRRRSSFASQPSLYPLWDEVIETSLDFSGIRLRNAVRP